HGAITTRPDLECKERSLPEAERFPHERASCPAIEVVEVVGAAEKRGECRAERERQLKIIGVGERSLESHARSCRATAALYPEQAARSLLRPRPADGTVGCDRRRIPELALDRDASEQSLDPVE